MFADPFDRLIPLCWIALGGSAAGVLAGLLSASRFVQYSTWDGGLVRAVSGSFQCLLLGCLVTDATWLSWYVAQPGDAFDLLRLLSTLGVLSVITAAVWTVALLPVFLLAGRDSVLWRFPLNLVFGLTVGALAPWLLWRDQWHAYLPLAGSVVLATAVYSVAAGIVKRVGDVAQEQGRVVAVADVAPGTQAP